MWPGKAVLASSGLFMISCHRTSKGAAIAKKMESLSSRGDEKNIGVRS